MHHDTRRDSCRRGSGPSQRGRARQGGEGQAALSIKWRSGGHNECVTVRQALRTFLLLAVLGLPLTGLHAGPRMDAIRARGHLVCGVAPEDPGFSRQGADGQFEGFESDLCRAIGAALLGSSEPVRFVPLETVHQFLADPQIDLVFHRLTWTLTREAPGQLEFGPVVLYEAAADGALEPLAPLLRSDDPDFSRVVRWTVYALIEAEQLGLNRANAQALGEGLGWPPEHTGAALGLAPDWARRAVAAVGNHGEIIERHLGAREGMPGDRAPNRLWRDGGLFLAPPVR